MTASPELRTGGEWIVEALRAEGVRHVFGLPGVHNLAIYDALLKQHEITHVLARHEQGAAFMADGYARASGRPGVVAVTTGPGATNTLTPMVESWAGSQPVLTLMSDIPSALIGKDLGALHEVPNQIDCFRPVSRWAETIHEGRLFPAAVQRAFHLFRTQRPGPVALSLPTDLLVAKTVGQLTALTGGRPACDPKKIDEAAEALRRARRPLIVAGGGTVAADAGAALAAVARRLGAPVLTSVMGRGILPETDPLWLGIVPNWRSSKAALESADVIVVNDQTGINYWMEWHFPVLRPRTFLYPIGSATLGYGVPAAVGAKVACPDRAVVAVIGDGGFMFSVNELATAVKYGLGIVFLVMNDERYGAIKYLQDAIFGKYGEVDLANPDFPAMARAFGAAGERVADLDALPHALERALKHAGPTVIELPLSVEPPWEL